MKLPRAVALPSILVDDLLGWRPNEHAGTAIFQYSFHVLLISTLPSIKRLTTPQTLVVAIAAGKRLCRHTSGRQALAAESDNISRGRLDHCRATSTLTGSGPSVQSALLHHDSMMLLLSLESPRYSHGPIQNSLSLRVPPIAPETDLLIRLRQSGFPLPILLTARLTAG